MSKKMNKMALLAAIEATVGVDAKPTGAANAMLVSDVTLTPLEGDEAERNNIKPWFGSDGSVLTTAYKKVAFSVEAAGAGAPGKVPAYGPLMRACGMAATVVADTSCTFTPVTDKQESVTLYANIDGTNHIMVGARGNVKLTADAKAFAKWQFEFTGLFVPLADQPLPAPEYGAFKDPLAVNKANSRLSLHGVACAASAFSFDCGNKVTKRDLMTVDSVEITDRKSTGSATFENHELAAKNWVDVALQSTKGGLQLVHGTQPGNTIEFNAPRAQVQKPSFSDSDGIQMVTTPLILCTGPKGNDEWSIVIR